MRIEAIAMDNDAEEALRFFKEVIKPKIRPRAQESWIWENPLVL